MDSYAIVYFPNIDNSRIGEIREKYDPMSRVISPHITIIFPFQNISENEIINHVDSVVSELKPFEIRLKGLTKSFDHYLFLIVTEGKEKVLKLHDRLYTNILASELQNDIPFIPHITLGFFGNKKSKLNENLYKKALQEAERLNLDFQVKVDSLALIKGDGIKPAQKIHTFTIT